MALYKQPTSDMWWYSVYRGKGRPRVRGSTGTADRREAEAVERAVRMAVGGKTPRDRVVAVIDALMGADRVGEGLPLAGIWDVYRGWAEGEGVELSTTTWRQRRRAVERFAEWAGECWTAAVCIDPPRPPQ